MKKTKFGDYERVIKFPVWSDYMVHIIFTHDIAASRKARYGSAGEADGARALHSSANGGHSHIFYRLGNCPSGVIAHEAWHAIRCMLVDFGGVTVMENEVTAYHLGHLVQAISDFKWALVRQDIGFEDEVLKQSKALGVKSSGRKQVRHGTKNKNSQGALAGLQSLSSHGGRVGTQEAGEAGTPEPSPQADGYHDDAGHGSATSGLLRTRGTGQRADKGPEVSNPSEVRNRRSTN